MFADLPRKALTRPAAGPVSHPLLSTRREASARASAAVAVSAFVRADAVNRLRIDSPPRYPELRAASEKRLPSGTPAPLLKRHGPLPEEVERRAILGLFFRRGLGPVTGDG